MKMSEYKPYYFDEKYEYKVYKNVGWDYKKSKLLNRKGIRPRKYKICNTYSEWKSHILDFMQGVTNHDDFLHLIMSRKNYLSSKLEVVKIITIPLYIGAFSTMNNVSDGKSVFWIFFSMALICIAVWTWLIYSKNEKLNFYDDVMEIVKNEMNRQS